MQNGQGNTKDGFMHMVGLQLQVSVTVKQVNLCDSWANSKCSQQVRRGEVRER